VRASPRASRSGGQISVLVPMPGTSRSGRATLVVDPDREAVDVDESRTRHRSIT
jgi:hypothetical protein